MRFDEIQKICEEKLGATKLADLAKEFSVTPQVVSNWKARNIVPYKYVKILRKKIKQIENEGNIDNSKIISPIQIVGGSINDDDNIVLIQLKGIVLTFIKNFKNIIIISSILIVISLLFLLISYEPFYISSTTLLPTGDGNQDKISSITSQFGLNTGSTSAKTYDSKVILPELIKSKSISKKLLFRKFNSNENGVALELYNILSNSEEKVDTTSGSTEFNTILAGLRNSIKVSKSKDRLSPVLNVRVITREAKLSQEIVRALIEELKIMQSQFNLKKLNQKKMFIERRFVEVSKTLKEKEDKLTNFRKLNRKLDSSPSLILEETRLLRDVTVQSEIFLTLKTQYELAKIEEVEKSGSISIIDEPSLNNVPINSPNYSLMFVLMLITVPFLLSSIVFYFKLYSDKYHKRILSYAK
tara:strand:+ start:6502 stop:7743 length:1242 start_codon:yes stop_codon:yes gene_type:complete